MTRVAIDPDLLERALEVSGERIVDRFSALPLLVPDRDDHIDAAELRNRCRRAGIQIGTIDALLAQLCIGHDLTMLTTDGDFRHVAKQSVLKVWSVSAKPGACAGAPKPSARYTKTVG